MVTFKISLVAQWMSPPASAGDWSWKTPHAAKLLSPRATITDAVLQSLQARTESPHAAAAETHTLQGP